MPISLYNFHIQGRNIHGGHTFKTQPEAQAAYDTIVAGLDKPFIEIKLGENVTTLRSADISGFGISVSLQETPEERKQRAIDQIERGGLDPFTNECSPKLAYSGALTGRLD